jgi:hypothetical protein
MERFTYKLDGSEVEVVDVHPVVNIREGLVGCEIEYINPNESGDDFLRAKIKLHSDESKSIRVNEQWRGSGSGRTGIYLVNSLGVSLIQGEACNWANQAICELLLSGKSQVEWCFSQYDNYTAEIL